MYLLCVSLEDCNKRSHVRTVTIKDLTDGQDGQIIGHVISHPKIIGPEYRDQWYTFYGPRRNIFGPIPSYVDTYQLVPILTRVELV